LAASIVCYMTPVVASVIVGGMVPGTGEVVIIIYAGQKCTVQHQTVC